MERATFISLYGILKYPHEFYFASRMHKHVLFVHFAEVLNIVNMAFTSFTISVKTVFIISSKDLDRIKSVVDDYMYPTNKAS